MRCCTICWATPREGRLASPRQVAAGCLHGLRQTQRSRVRQAGIIIWKTRRLSMNSRDASFCGQHDTLWRTAVQLRTKLNAHMYSKLEP